MKKLKVKFEDDGKKLSTYLTSIYPKLNINAIYKALRKKDIKVNGKRINENIIVSYDDELEVYIADNILEGISNVEIPKLYEDDNIVIFNKPINFEVEGKNSLTELMEKQYKFIEPCHRIDRNTIGLVIFAKNQESLDIMFDKFKNNEIEKHYIACCYNIPKQNATLNAYLFKDNKKSLVYISDTPKKGAVKITTSYKLIDSNKEKNLSILDVTLHTGRTHQIRAHLAHASLPIIGDGKYGSYELNKRFKQSTQCLCSYSITFKPSQEPNKLSYLDNMKVELKKIPFKDLL